MTAWWVRVKRHFTGSVTLTGKCRIRAITFKSVQIGYDRWSPPHATVARREVRFLEHIPFFFSSSVSLMSLLMLSGLAFTRVGNFRYLSPVRTLIQTETQMCVTQREAIEAIGYHLPGRTFRCVSSLRTFRSRCGRFFGTVSDCACVVTPVYGYRVSKC